MSGEVLGPRALGRALLARPLLLHRHEMPVIGAISHLVGMQAQVPNAPYVGLWSRLEGFDPEDLSRSIREREAVRTHVMRTTIHLVSARDCALLCPLLQPAIARSFHGSPFSRELEGLSKAELAEVDEERERLLAFLA